MRLVDIPSRSARFGSNARGPKNQNPAQSSSAGQDDARIALQMTVAQGRAAARIGLEPNLNRYVSMLRAHAAILHVLKADGPGGAQAHFRSIS